jgi:hypothetical protein
MIALIAALWAYDGWSDVSQMAGEVQKPQRSLPVALIGGVTIVGALYMLTNAAIQYVLPSAAIAATDRPATDALQLVAGNLGAGWWLWGWRSASAQRLWVARFRGREFRLRRLVTGCFRRCWGRSIRDSRRRG